jgi:electron transport complex protein RnfD
MTLPPSITPIAVLVGSVVAIFIGKEVFGGLGANIFNPALVGRAFLAAAYPVSMTTWKNPASVFGFLHPQVDAATSATPLAAAKFDHVFTPSLNLLFGQTGGSIGETSTLLLALGGLVLIILGIVRWPVVVSFIGSVFVFGELFHLINPAVYPSGLFELFAGGLALGAFYMATDMVTSPFTDKGAVIFGIGAGVLVIIIRLFGGYPEGVMYAILLMNAVTPIINRYVKTKTFGSRARSAEAAK